MMLNAAYNSNKRLKEIDDELSSMNEFEDFKDLLVKKTLLLLMMFLIVMR